MLKEGALASKQCLVNGHMGVVRPAVVAALTVVAVACSGPPAPTAEQHLDIILRDFAIEPEDHVLAPGLTDFHGTNEGPTVHELILVRTELADDALPLQADGLTAVEEAPDVEFVIADEGIDLGEAGGFQADLRPGNYVIYCNLEGHYLGDMTTELEVREGLS